MTDQLSPHRSRNTPSSTEGVASATTQVPAYAWVCQQLRQDILAGTFAWGARLKIAQLAQRYGVSQMPIREALQRLQGEGLVTIQPNCGACVRRVDDKFVADIYDLRGALGELLISRAIPRITSDDIRALEIIIDTHQQAERRGELSASLEYNKQFHRVIYRVADNPDATEILERYWELIDALRRQFGFAPGFLAKIISGHRRLLAAISQGDIDAALRLARENCEQSMHDLIAQMHRQRSPDGTVPLGENDQH